MNLKLFLRSYRGIEVKKCVRIMKLTWFLILALTLQVNASLWSQNTKMDVTLKNTSLLELFNYIESNSEYRFFYSNDEVDVNKKVTVLADNEVIGDILMQAFSELPYSFKELRNNMILVELKSVSTESVLSQQNSISGKVTDSSGVPLPGVTVLVVGTGSGTVTDADGKYALPNVPESAVLQFSFIGMKTQEIAVKGKSQINVSMLEESIGLEEVVAIGYGTQAKSNISSSIGNFKPSEMTSRQSTGVEGLLQGRVAGVVISSSSGIPGSRSRVNIRGAGSLSASNEPLYVIDGVPINSASSADLGNYGQSMNIMDILNPEDIESINVLKDASSAAIYGSRATNGVIIITTKSGKQGKTRVSVNASTGMQWLPRTDKLQMADSKTYLEVINEAIDNWNIQKGTNETPRIDNPYPGKADTDWLDLILRNAKVQNVFLSVTGGNESSNYYISGNIKHQEGVFKGNAVDRYNLKLKQDRKISNRFTLGTNVTLGYSQNNRVPTGYNIGSNLIPRALEQRTWDSPIKPDGNWYRGGVELLNHNPVQILNEEDVYLNNFKTIASVYGLFKITEALSFKSTLGADIGYTEEHIYYTSQHPYGNSVGRLVDGRRWLTSYLTENLVTYDKMFDDLYVNVIAGHSFQHDGSSMAEQTGIGFPSSSFDVNSVAAEVQNVTTGLSAYALQSFFTRAQLNYDRKYLLSLSMRADGSSRFAPENRYGYFPSVSAGWIMSEEGFWKAKGISAKVRASYGSTGNQAGIATYAYQALAGGGYNYNNKNGLGIATAGNRNLEWEKANQTDVGVDLSFLKGALTFTADAFVKNTKNLLYSRPTAATTGFTTYMSNIGSMQNKGIEFTAGYNFNRGGFSYETDFNISFVRNRLTSLLGDDVIIRPDATHILKVGEEVGSFYMVKQIGIYQSDDEIPEKIYAEGVRAGDVKYEDVNDDGYIDRENDSQIVGSANPKFTAGWNHSLKYRSFDLSFFFNSSYGNKVYQLWTGGYRLGNGYWPMLQDEADKRWTGPGTSNSVPRAIYGVSWNSTKFPSTRFLHDGSYIRLRNITLGYTMPKKWVSKLNIASCRLYVQADNLFVLTKYPLLDPEVSVSLSPVTMGYDFLLPSQPTVINFGVNLKL